MRGLTIITLAAFIGQPLQAQSAPRFEDDGRAEMRAMVGVTIPLGGRRNAANTEPRLDLRFDHSRIDSQAPRARTLNPLHLDRRNLRESVFSLTFEARPQLMLNGQSFDRFGPILHADDDTKEAEKEDRSTGEKVLRGAGWVGIGLVGVVAVGAGIFLLECGKGSGCFDEQ